MTAVVEQIGTPLELYDRPGNLFVAGFIGSPAMNFLKGTVRRNGSRRVRGAERQTLPLAARARRQDGRPVVYGVRPEHFALSDDGAAAEILVVEPTGSETAGRREARRQRRLAVFRERHHFKPGDKIRLKPDARLVHLFDETTGERT